MSKEPQQNADLNINRIGRRKFMILSAEAVGTAVLAACGGMKSYPSSSEDLNVVSRPDSTLLNSQSDKPKVAPVDPEFIGYGEPGDQFDVSQWLNSKPLVQNPPFMIGVVAWDTVGKVFEAHVKKREAQDQENCSERASHNWKVALAIIAAGLAIEELKGSGNLNVNLESVTQSYAVMKTAVAYYTDIVLSVSVSELETYLGKMGTSLKDMGLTGLKTVVKEGLVTEGDRVLFLARLGAKSTGPNGYPAPSTAFFLTKKAAFEQAEDWIKNHDFTKNPAEAAMGAYLLNKAKDFYTRLLQKERICKAKDIFNIKATPTPTAGTEDTVNGVTVEEIEKNWQYLLKSLQDPQSNFLRSNPLKVGPTNMLVP